METLGHFCNGKPYAGTSGRTGPVFNPSTGEQQSLVSLASRADVDHIVRNAAEAFPGWAATTPIRRARVMFKFKELIERNMDRIARAVSLEHGKVLDDAKGSVIRGLEVVEFACGIPQLLKGDFSENVGSDIDSWCFRQPLGVCAGITPFNFPAMVPMWMFPMAIACGNTFVLKPSEKDPGCPMILAELLHEAGLPDGVFNVANGDKEAVDALLTHPDVQAISFVGSTPVGEYIYHTGSANNKRVQALCGAKNHMVIMPDADIDQAVDALMGAAYGSAGERCMAVSVAVAVGDAGDRLMEQLKPRVEALQIGPSLESGMDMGPLVTGDHHAKVKGYIDIGVDEGADLVVDGRNYRCQNQGYENGFFIGGSLFDNVTTDMRIYKEEIFGPVLSVVRKDSFNDALQIVNDHEFGNGTAIFTRDGDAARAFAHQCKIGMVGVNVPIPVPVAYHSFGGWKRSAFGSHGAHGEEAVHFYTKRKTITSRWPTGIRAGAEFTMPTLK